MKNFSFDKMLILLLVISMVSGIMVINQRMNIESEHKQIEIYIDYYEIKELAEQSEYSFEWWLSKFKELGATHVVLEEDSLGLLRQELEPLSVEVGRDILREWNWERFAPESLVHYHSETGIDDYDVVVMTEEKDLYDKISNGLISRYKEERFTLLEEGETYAVVIHGSINDAVFTEPQQLEDTDGRSYMWEQRVHSSQLNRLSLGFNPDKVEVIKNAGLEIMPRPHGYKDWTGEKYIDALIEDMAFYDIEPSVMFFSGRQIPGYVDGSISKLESHLIENGINLGMIETSFQREHLELDGFDELANGMKHHSVRVFNIWPFVQQRYQFYHYEGAEEIENTLYRAVTERNIRVIYFKPFMENPNVYITDAAEYEKTFERFEERISRHGMSLGEASTFSEHQAGLIWILLMVVGVAAGMVLVMKKLLPLPNMLWGILLVLVISALFGLWMLRPTWGEKLIALAGAVIFPSLGMHYFCEDLWKISLMEKKQKALQAFSIGILILLKVTAISAIGAIIVAAVLSDVRYLLEMDIFRGVKIAQLIPIGVFALQFMYFFGYKRKEEEVYSPQIRLYEIRSLLMENIKIIYVAVLGLVMITGYVYLARTGHEGNLQPLELEMIIRNFLEEKLLVRPRTKEFTVAFPALMLGGYIASLRFKSLLFLTGMAAVIGQTSIVNTFSHLRTPVYVSVIRTIYSLIASVPFFAAYLLGLMMLVAIFKRWIRPMWDTLDLDRNQS
ncbi:DUF5693 family protein [Tindallia californiensis]|uniref:Uncharacterized protein n=1 Tax=Tindallia californiensis TaxID=159292 RepID=A0A1H3K540_9FIRM|nr:DUF5693 family protein [Tindallia californiensis]SDY46969.1 hypothetical protein SAMN05192546_102220 [Tindallia californiensis]